MSGIHVREQIIEAIAVCITGLPTTGTRVFESRVDALERDQLPCLTTRFLPATESITPITMAAPRRLDCRCRPQVVISARASDEVTVRKQVNAISLEVQMALAMPAAVGPWKILTPLGFELNLSGAGEQVAGEGILTYEAQYYIAENAPDVAL